jgi:hypothetical protein
MAYHAPQGNHLDEKDIQHPTSRRKDAGIFQDSQSMDRGWQDQSIDGNQDAKRSHTLALARS